MHHAGDRSFEDLVNDVIMGDLRPSGAERGQLLPGNSIRGVLCEED